MEHFWELNRIWLARQKAYKVPFSLGPHSSCILHKPGSALLCKPEATLLHMPEATLLHKPAPAQAWEDKPGATLTYTPCTNPLVQPLVYVTPGTLGVRGQRQGQS